MEPIARIVAAVTTGAATGAYGAATSQRVTEAFTELNQLITGRYESVDVEAAEQRPGSDTQRVALAQQLRIAGAADDQEVLAAAEEVLERERAPGFAGTADTTWGEEGTGEPAVRSAFALDAVARTATILEVLDERSAVDLFIGLSGRGVVSGTERRAVDRIVRACGCLPLPIMLLAGYLSDCRLRSVSELADDLAAQNRLEGADSSPHSVRTAFTLAWRNLPWREQRMLHCLGLHFGTEIDAHAAAALAGTSPGAAHRQLEALHTTHFVEKTRPGRYQLHIPLRVHARARADSDPDDSGAVLRLLDYYRTSAASADRFIGRHIQPCSQAPQPAAHGQEFDNNKAALTWLRQERGNLFACLDLAADRYPRRFLILAESLVGLLEHDELWGAGADLYERALITARHLADPLAEANALVNLGIMRRYSGDYSGAAELFEQAMTLYREVRNRLGEANCLSNLANVNRITGDHATSTQQLRHSLVLHRASGNRVGEAFALMILGLVQTATGDCDDAQTTLQQALSLYQGLGNQRGEAFTCINLADVHRHTGDYVTATALQQRALVIFRGSGHRLGEADALTSLGDMRALNADHIGAADLYRQAVTLHSKAGNRSGQAYVLTRLGEIYRATGDHGEAAGQHQHAVALARELGYRRIEAEALNRLGALLLDTGEIDQALGTFTDAFALAREIPCQIEQARALQGSSRCRAELGDVPAAVDELAEAVRIYRHLGTADAESAANQLAELNANSPSY
jgi:tetratricopeptide (TPR) repeat protein